jgi:two-component system, chemotaxis family, response regulator Rcp1
MSGPLNGTRQAEILLVEDNDNDVELTRMAFQKSRLLVKMHHAKDGEECMAFLRTEGKYADAPTPDLILLDLNLPRMDGREVLTEISADASLRHLPVVILTTSAEESEILKMYQLRCSSYIIKPVNLDRFMRVIQSLTDYWLTVVVLPPAPPA